MAFKSLIIFALVASVGRVMAAPLAAGHLGARSSCQGTWCARHTIDGGRSDLSRRLAEFDGGNVTLSSGIPNPPVTSVNSSSSTLSVDPSSTLSINPSSTFSVDPSSPSSVGGPPAETKSHKRPSSTSDGTPQATDPASGGPVTITVISTVFLNPTDPAVSLPTQSPASSNSVVSSSSVINLSSTVSGNPSSSILVNPSATLPTDGISASPGPIKPSVSSPVPLVSPSIIELTNGVIGSSVSSNPASQPTPSPTPTGIIFLPPS